MLEVVENDQQLALADVLGDTVPSAERQADRAEHARRLPERGKPDPEDACGEGGNERGGSLDREPRLAAAAGAGEGEEARTASDACEDVFELAVPADERSGGPGEVRR